MLSTTMIHRALILGFMMLVGFSLAKSIYSGSLIGLCLAVISLCAGVYFLYILAKMKAGMEQEDQA